MARARNSEGQASPHLGVRKRIEDREFLLSPLAAKSRYARGRDRPEEPSSTRSDFQRDRDRVVHCKAFHRLKHKTQVFFAPLGDHYVTRLTHTLELSQIARSISRALNVNEDLTEAIALAHDLGHPPFGHAGEEALDQVVLGGFRHNEQSLRIVEVLEKDGQGLNLTWETRESLPKHSKAREGVMATGWGTSTTLEGQIVKLADAIAYLNHDIRDAIRAGLISEDTLPARSRAILGTRHAERINTMVVDAIDSSWQSAQADESSAGQTRAQFAVIREQLESRAAGGDPVIRLSPPIENAVDELREFMFQNVYLDSAAKEDVGKAQNVIRLLYSYFRDDPAALPAEFSRRQPGESIERVVADYVAGMTDRYALKVFEDVYFPRLWSVLG